MNFKFRIDDMELRSCNQHLLSEGEHTTAEIIYWSEDKEGKKFCWAVAYWVKNDKGYYLKFVGSRPFDKFDLWSEFGQLARQGQELLDKHFEEENENV